MANRTVSVRLQAEIGQYVSGMSKASAATMRLGQSAMADSKKARSGFDLAGKGAFLLGGAVVAGLGLAVGKSMEFEKAMSGVAAATQETGAALRDLREAAMEAGAETQYSATEAAQAITEMGKAGVATADILGGGLDGALSLAAAGQLEVAKAAEIASVAMTQFKLTGDQLPHVADLLAAGAGKAMGSVEDLGMALNQAGLVASASGLNIEETTGTLAAFASAGLIGSDAGTSLKTMLQKLQAPSKEAAELMSDLGINMYDANGNFAGMDSLAGQLKTGMANLTPAVRDAAMATIFGSDAVRAANVLYSQGAEGIAEWTSKVNDQGYAAKQAAALNDNLAGDLEKLGGAFDTLMISMGSGAQGPLRYLVQGFTSLLDGISDLGGPLKSLAGFIADNNEIALALAGVLAIQLAGGITAVTVAFNSMVLTPVVLGLSGLLGVAGNLPAAFAAARSAVAGFIASAAPLAAVGAVIYAVTKLVEMSHAAEDAREEIAGMWKTVGDSRGSSQLEALADYVDQLSDKVKGLREEMDDRGFWSNVWAGPFDDRGDTAVLEEYEKALRNAEEAEKDAVSTARILGNQFGLNRQQVLDLADKYNIDLTVGTQNAYLQFQRFYTTEYGKGPEDSTARLNGALGVMADKSSTAEEKIDALKTALDLLGGKQVSVFEATSALQQVVQSATGAMEGLSGEVLTADGHLNAYTESGQKAGEILIGVRDKGNDLIATMIEQGATIDEVRAADAELRQSFIDSAMAMGIGEDAANALATEILGVPTDRETRFAAAVDQALANIAVLQGRIDAAAKDRSATITIRANMPDLNGVVSGSGRMGTYASGGTPRAGEVALVGEEGPEIVRFGAAATVYTAAETRSMLSGRETTPIFRGREFSGASSQTVVVQAPAAAQGNSGPLVSVGTMIVPDSQTPYETAVHLTWMGKGRG